MRSIKIEIEAPDGTTYSVEMNDALALSLAGDGTEMIDKNKEALKRLAGLL